MAELGGSSARSAAFAAVGLPPASTLARQILMLARLDSALLGLKKQLAVLSMTEGFVAVVALLFWMANTTQQRGIWLHFPHFARWILGIILIQEIPQLDEFLPADSDSCESSADMVNIIAQQAHEKVLSALLGSKHLVAAYFGLTAFAFVFDVIALLMDIFGFKGSSHHTILLIVASSFALMDMSLLYIIVQWKWVLPREYQAQARKWSGLGVLKTEASAED